MKKLLLAMMFVAGAAQAENADLNKIENWGQLKRYVIENVKEKH